ncbi:hypothetical protein [Sulfurimonas sp.]
MRFTLIKDLKKENSMRYILNALLLFIVLYLTLDIYVKYLTIGLTPQLLSASLYGDENEFLDPMPLSVFLEFIHVEIFFMMILLLTLSAIYIRTQYKKKFAPFLLHLTSLSAIFSIFSVTVAFFLSSAMIYLYIICFYIWHFSALFISLSSLRNLNFAESI